MIDRADSDARPITSYRKWVTERAIKHSSQNTHLPHASLQNPLDFFPAVSVVELFWSTEITF